MSLIPLLKPVYEFHLLQPLYVRSNRFSQQMLFNLHWKPTPTRASDTHADRAFHFLCLAFIPPHHRPKTAQTCPDTLCTTLAWYT